MKVLDLGNSNSTTMVLYSLMKNVRCGHVLLLFFHNLSVVIKGEGLHYFILETIPQKYQQFVDPPLKLCLPYPVCGS